MKLLRESKLVTIITAGIVLILINKAIDNYRDIFGHIKNFIGILAPFIYGLVIAFFLSRPVDKLKGVLEKRRIRFLKGKELVPAVAGVYAIVLLIIGFALTFLVPKLYLSAQDFVMHLPDYYRYISDFAEENEYIQKIISFDTVESMFFEMINMRNVNKWFGIISGIANSFLSAFLAIVFSIYLILEKNSIFNFLKKVRAKYFKTDKCIVFIKYCRKIVDLFYSYVAGMAIDACIVAVVMTVILSLFGVPYAALLGLLIGVGNMIPFFGAIISSVVVALITVITSGIADAVWIICIMIVVSQLDANLLQPRILSSSMGISPLLVLLSVILFGGVFGIVGMIVGVPVCAVLKMVVCDYLDNGKIDDSVGNVKKTK